MPGVISLPRGGWTRHGVMVAVAALGNRVGVGEERPRQRRGRVDPDVG
jgi:hypothetical protein